MGDVLSDLKSRARILHRQVRDGDPRAISRIQRLPDLTSHAPDQLQVEVKRRHCLAVLARELGFDGWPHVASVADGESAASFGTMLYPGGASAFWNIWCATYEEAASIREEHGGYLLGYKHQYFIVDRHFIEMLGLDPDDPDWEPTGRDWVHPRSRAARDRLWERLIAARLDG